MAGSLFGLQDLSDKLNASVGSSGTSDDVAGQTGQAVQGWLKESIFPLMIGVVIFVTVLAVFYGAFQYFTAYGDENKATSAKKTITYGFIGLFIALIAFTITAYVSQNLMSKDAIQDTYNSNTQIAPITEEGDYGKAKDLLK